QLLSPEEEHSSDSSDETPPTHDRSVALGLIPAPEMPQRLAQELSTGLPQLLSRRVDDSVSWEVSVICDPLTGSDPDAARVIDAGSERMVEEGWNLAICLTDLPIRIDGRPVVATVSTTYNVAVLSLPPLGVALLRQQVREATLQLVNELYEGSPELGRDGEYREDDEERDSGEVRRPGFRAHQLVERRLTELISPIRRITPTNEEDAEVNVRFVSPKVRGHVRLLAGMVLANRPWRLFTTMKGTLAAAFATAAYALVMPIIWQMADSLSWVRLLALMVLAIVAMVVWIIVAHHLWERPAEQEARDKAALYNAATVLTLSEATYGYRQQRRNAPDDPEGSSNTE